MNYPFKGLFKTLDSLITNSEASWHQKSRDSEMLSQE